MRVIGFLLAVVCAAGLDGAGWQTALCGVMLGAAMFALPYAAKGVRRWIAS